MVKKWKNLKIGTCLESQKILTYTANVNLHWKSFKFALALGTHTLEQTIRFFEPRKGDVITLTLKIVIIYFVHVLNVFEISYSFIERTGLYIASTLNLCIFVVAIY